MKSPFTFDSIYLCVLLAVLFGMVTAGVSPGPGPSRIRTSSVATQTPTLPLCKKHSVQCCLSTAESNSTTAASVFEQLGISIPKKVVEIGINCTSISDEDVRGGFCDASILCCHKTYNETLHDGKNTTIGVNCTDVAV